MPSLSTLVDNFNDNAIAGNWGNAYGGVSEVGGRARVPCGTGFAGYQTAYSWTMAGATIYVQVPVVPVAGAATEAYCTVFINSGTAGTRLGFVINAVTALLRCTSETGYYDPAAVNIAYSPTAHLWLRLREDGTNVYWDTSPDGTTWTNRRTLATPAWITTGIDTVALDMSSHRDAGTVDFAEYDNFNTMSNGAVITASAALSADGALGAAASKATVISAALTADAALGADSRQTVLADADLSVIGELGAHAQGDEIVDVDVYVGAVTGGWEVHGPWV